MNEATKTAAVEPPGNTVKRRSTVDLLSPTRNGAFARVSSSMDDSSLLDISPIKHAKKLPKRINSSKDNSYNVSIANSTIEITACEVTLDDVSQSPITPKINTEDDLMEYQLGQLAWARLGHYPYWPCIVTLDPDTKKYQDKIKYSKSFIDKIHINYFADNGRRGWISTRSLMPFKGKDHFLKLKECHKNKNMAGFVVNHQYKQRWETSINEAMKYMPKTHAERLKMFHEELQQLLSQPKKRKSTLAHNKVITKKVKIETSTPTNSSKTDSLNFLTPDEKNITPMRTKRSESRMKLANKSLDSYLQKENPQITTRNRSESRMSRRLSDNQTPNLVKDESAKQIKRPESRMSMRIKMMEVRKHNNSTIDFIKNMDLKNQPNEVVRKNAKESSSSSEDDLTDEPVKEKKSKPPQNLLRGYKLERVCQICEKSGDLIRCKGPCFSYFHLSCVNPDETNSENEAEIEAKVPSEVNGIMEDLKIIKENMQEDQEKNGNSNDGNSNVSAIAKDELFKCIDCLSGVAPACFICMGREGDRIRCSVLACGKYYHVDCFKLWPQAHWQGGRLTCPYHVCHTCISDNPQMGHYHPTKNNDKFVRCVRCPSTYHASISCIPAGTSILTGLQIICPKHYECHHPPINTTWCFLCTEGGSLICCDTCPMSFHAECLSISPPDGAYICEDCETGRLPLYGEIVWAKLGNYRWWPSVVCYPSDIPDNVAKMSHSTGEFCVMFLGSNDYYWVHRGRVFLYQEGDCKGKTPIGKTLMNQTYKKALNVAQEMHVKFKMDRELKRQREQNKSLKPPRYVKLKSNKPYGNVKAPELDSATACNCNPNTEKPCAPEANCINRLLSYECSTEICPAGLRCHNQDFQQCNYPVMKPFHTDGRGWGLKTLEKIKQGRFVVEYVGEIIDEAEYKRRLQRKRETKNDNFYFLTIDNNRMIDAEPKGNLSRFMNHSCQPNCETQKWTVNGDTRIGLFAVRDIEPGEELTFNYQLQCDGEEKKPCLCGAPNCSGFIGLKANKIQINGINEKMIKKDNKKEIKKDEVEVVDLKSARGRKAMCFQCGLLIVNKSEIVRCAENHCIKKYHKSCLGLSSIESNYICPHHKCGQCNRKSKKRCNLCCTSWCLAHYSSEKMKEHKATHGDPNDTDNESQVSQTDTRIEDSLSTLNMSVDELSTSNCSTSVSTRLKRDKHKNLKTPLSLENSVEKSKNKLDEKNDLLNLKTDVPEIKVTSKKRAEPKSTLKLKTLLKEISDAENQSPLKIIDPPLSKRKTKILNFVEEVSDTEKKTDLRKFTEKVNATFSHPYFENLKEDTSEDWNGMKIDDDVMLQMFFETSTIDDEMVCAVCKKPHNLVRCNGPCSRYLHEKCSNNKVLRRNGQRNVNNDNPKIFKCIDCLSGVQPSCGLCNTSSHLITSCSVVNCKNYYHPSCLQTWPQSFIIKGKSVCPQHICHTCASKDLINNKPVTISFEKMHKCIRCYTAYHSYPWCIPAGSIILSSDTIICPKHYTRNKSNNLEWCIQCSRNDVNVHCAECPVSYHKECLDEHKVGEKFICKNCKFGKLPLYNEVVWVKDSVTFKCWPAVVCTSTNIPFSLLQAKHKPGEFCVHYLEANKYAYVGREVIIPFEGDNDVEVIKLRTGTDDSFTKAVLNAQRLSKQFEMIIQKKMNNNISKLAEPIYEHLKMNDMKREYPVNICPSMCKCDPLMDNPCGIGIFCDNRNRRVECDPSTCPAGPTCGNQMFSKRLYLATEKFCTDDRGWGLRALEPAVKGEFIIEYIGEVVDYKTVRRRIEKNGIQDESIYYMHFIRSRFLYVETKGNFSRFINHSCNPNCTVQRWTARNTHRLGIFALRDIKIGEELTISYKTLNKSKRIPCLCKASNCSGFIGLSKENMCLDLTAELNSSIDSTLEIDSSHNTEESQEMKDEKKEQILEPIIFEYRCWKCNHDFTNLMHITKCDDCDKQYHTTCIENDEKNLSSCPWHFCKTCKQRTDIHCYLCSAAYCSGHCTNKLFLQDDHTTYRCSKHNKKSNKNNRRLR